MTIRFRLPPDLEARLVARAERNDLTAAAAALRILDDHADDDTPLAPWTPADPMLTARPPGRGQQMLAGAVTPPPTATRPPKPPPPWVADDESSQLPLPKVVPGSAAHLTATQDQTRFTLALPNRGQLPRVLELNCQSCPYTHTFPGGFDTKQVVEVLAEHRCEDSWEIWRRHRAQAASTGWTLPQ